MHHIGVGRTCPGTCVILLVQDLEMSWSLGWLLGVEPGVVVALEFP
jgi:hypothetical protein